MATSHPPHLRHRVSLGAAVCAVAALVGCGGTPGGSSKQPKAAKSVPSIEDAAKQVNKGGPVTLDVLDQEGPGSNGSKEYPKLIKAFEQKYPNITVKRQVKSFDQLTKTLPLRLSGKKVPDVIESDQGYSTQGRLVKAGLMQPLDAYAKAWGWDTRQTPEQLVGMRVRTDGTHLGEGNLYGLSASQSLVGLYYNRKLMDRLGIDPPTTKAAFEDSLAKAKAAGITPLVGADGDGQATEWGLTLALAMNADPAAVRDTLLGADTKGFQKPEFKTAIEELKSWGEKGYFPDGYRGITSDVAATRFSKGGGLYFMNGTWWAGQIKESLGEDAGFMTPPAGPSGKSALIAAPNQPWEIPAKAKDKLAGLLWIDFITRPENTGVFLEQGDVPATKFDSPASAAPLVKDVLGAAAKVAGDGGQLPFSWAIPTYQQDFLYGPGVGLAGGKLSADKFIKDATSALEKDAAKYRK